MKQQVNLLPLVIQKQRILSSRLLLGSWLMLIVLLVLISGNEFYKVMELRQSLADLDFNKIQVQDRLDKLATNMPGKDEAEFLTSEIDRLEAEAKTKRRVISELSGRAIGNTVGFSGYLEGFAKQISDGIWLRRISIADGGSDLNIDGTTLSPALVPRFLNDLSNEKVFTGSVFKSFIMNRPEDGEELSQKIDFTIQTSLSEGSSSAASFTDRKKTSIDRQQAIFKNLNAGTTSQGRGNTGDR